MSTDGWPREVGGHRVTTAWECERCGASFDCLENFRQNDCS